MDHPFAELIDLRTEEQRDGHSRLSLVVAPTHLNPHQVVHGAVLYALADTGMGSALYPSLAEGEICATIEIKINYFKPVSTGTLNCITQVVNRGRTRGQPGVAPVRRRHTRRAWPTATTRSSRRARGTRRAA